jgi:hypothetical protein
MDVPTASPFFRNAAVRVRASSVVCVPDADSETALTRSFLNCKMRQGAADQSSTNPLRNYLLAPTACRKSMVLVSKSKIAFGILGVPPATAFKSKENTRWQRQKQPS